jgi:hypothetical protein
MRTAVIALALLAAACGQSTSTTVSGPVAATQAEDAYAGSSGAGPIPEQPFTLEAEALVGLWSFARHCGDYDLVLNADGDVEHYVVSPTGMTTSYGGSWSIADSNRVVLTLQRLGADGARSGEAITYTLDVAAPVTDDLVGRFARTDGAEARDITARRCPEEDRD